MRLIGSEDIFFYTDGREQRAKPHETRPKASNVKSTTITKKPRKNRSFYIGSAREVKPEFKPAIKADVFLSHREELLTKQYQARLLSEKLKSAKNIK